MSVCCVCLDLFVEQMRFEYSADWLPSSTKFIHVILLHMCISCCLLLWAAQPGSVGHIICSTLLEFVCYMGFNNDKCSVHLEFGQPTKLDTERDKLAMVTRYQSTVDLTSGDGGCALVKLFKVQILGQSSRQNLGRNCISYIICKYDCSSHILANQTLFYMHHYANVKLINIFDVNIFSYTSLSDIFQKLPKTTFKILN